MPRVIVTLTTVPTRLHDEQESSIKSCIYSLVNQSYENYEIHFNIPEVNKTTNDAYNIPQWLTDLSAQQPKLKLFRVEDLGAITKLVYTLKRVDEQDAIIITVDDDLVYHADMVKEQVANQDKFAGYAVGYDGLGIKTPTFNDVRDHFVVSVNGNYEVKVLQAYKSVSYRRSYFLDDYFTDFVGKSWADDLVNSAYMGHRGIKRMVTYHPSDPVIESIDDWRRLGGVLTFPVLRHTHHQTVEGCSIMRHNNVSDNGSYLYKFIDK